MSCGELKVNAVPVITVYFGGILDSGYLNTLCTLLQTWSWCSLIVASGLTHQDNSSKQHFYHERYNFERYRVTLTVDEYSCFWIKQFWGLPERNYPLALGLGDMDKKNHIPVFFC